ncbi:MAG: penicillin-binding protein activator [Desulfovibrionaceae bacterium]
MNTPRICPRCRAALLTVLCLAALLLAPGCMPKRELPPLTPPATAKPDKDARLHQADAAWNAQDTVRSEIMYRALLDSPDLTAAQHALAWERYTLAALGNNHPHLAMEAFPKWQDADPGAIDRPVFQDAYFDTIRRIGSTPESTRLLQKTLADTHMPWRMRTEAGLILCGRQWATGALDDAMNTLDTLYAAARTDAYRAALEAGLLRELGNQDDALLTALAERAPEGKAFDFPYVIIDLERSRRLAQSDDTWPRAWQRMRRILSEGRITDKELVTAILLPLEQGKGQPLQGIVLALPLSGQFSGVGWKVLRGAGVAQWDLAQAGVDLTVEVVNTDAPDWLDTLHALPKAYAVVGGPLRVDIFKQLKEDGALAKRAFFTFLSGMGDTAEGREAWRFFSGPRDQARSLVHLANAGLGIQAFATLYPEEPYGRRMAQLFSEEAAADNATVVSSVSYPPGDPKALGGIIGSLLDVQPTQGDNLQLPPEPPFQAVFLPDSWSKAELIVPHFLFHQEERLVFLGPTLWGQALSAKQNPDTRNFNLAVFPGAWWPDNSSDAAVELRQSLAAEGLGAPDFWVALGFDFVRFASQFGPLPPAWTPEDVNRRVYAAQDISWAMAPLYWSEEGQGGQELFMFTPTSRGPQMEDIDLLRRRLERFRGLHERRVEMVKAKLEEEAQKRQSPKQ